MPGGAAALVPEGDEHLHLLAGGNHPSETGEVGSQARHLEVGQPGDPAHLLDGPVRPHALPQITDIDHHHDLVAHPGHPSGVRERLRGLIRGDEGVIGPAHGLRCVAGGRGPQQHGRQVQTRLRYPFQVVDPRIGQHHAARPLQRPQQRGMGLHDLGDRRHPDPLRTALGDHRGGVVGDPVDVDLQSRGFHVHPSGVSSSIGSGSSPTSSATQSRKVAATSSW